MSLNITDFNLVFMWKLQPSWKKSPPFYPLNVEVLSYSPFWELGWRFNHPLSAAERVRVVEWCTLFNYHSFLWNHPTELWWNMLEILEIQRKNRGYEIVNGTHSTCPAWRLLESNNDGLQVHPVLAYSWDLNCEFFKSVCYLLSY